MQQPPESPLVQLAKALENLPKYLGGYIIGFVVIVLTDVLMTSLFFGCVLLSIAASPLAGGVVLMLGYAAVRIVNEVSNAIGFAGRNIGTAIRPPIAPPPMQTMTMTPENLDIQLPSDRNG